MNIEISGDGVKIGASEEEKSDIFAFANTLAERAVAFSGACADELVEKHGASRGSIAMMIFYESFIGRLLSGKSEPTPSEYVEHVVKTYKPEFIGLAPAGAYHSKVAESIAEYEKLKREGYGGNQ